MHNMEEFWEYYAKWKTQRATYDSDYIKCQKRQIHRQKADEWLPPAEEGVWKWQLTGLKVSFQDNESIFELEMMFALSCKYAKTTELYTLKSDFYDIWVISQ